MPIYTYRCNSCGHEFEKRQRMSDAPLTQCLRCDGTIRRVVNSVGVVFKGSGFYITDNRNGKNPAGTPARSTSSSTESPTPATPTSTSDSTPKTTTPATT